MRCIKNLRIKIRFDVVASRGVMRCRFFNVVIFFLVYNFILRAACLAVTRDFGSGSHSERTISHMFASSSKSKSHFCFENRAPETLPPSADLHFCKSLSYFVMSSVRNCFIFFASCK